MGEKYWKKIVIRLLLRLYKEHVNRKRRNSPIEKWTESLNWHIEVRKKKANSHENTCKLNIVQKMENKTDFFLPIKSAKITALTTPVWVKVGRNGA